MSLSDTQAKTVDGSSLPRFVHDIINYLDRNACSVEGVFRKNGMKSRIQEIKECCSKLEPNQQIPNYLLMESQVHDIADVLKQYLRELPECLMTDQISEILENSVTELPESKHFGMFCLLFLYSIIGKIITAALHYCILVMPPENRQVLMILLKFLSKIANSSNINQMSAQNLATCLMPTLFRFGTQGNLDQNLARTQLKYLIIGRF
jgi:hypothetical protein